MKYLMDVKQFQLGDLKVTRHLASEITTRGASLYDLLLKEIDLRVSLTFLIVKYITMKQ